MESPTLEYRTCGDREIHGQFPSPRDGLNLHEVQRVAAGYSGDIKRNWNTLNAIVQRHDHTIQKRWSKKSLPKRLQILKNAEPGLPASRRVAFAPMRRLAKKNGKFTTSHDSGVHLRPYANIEDLTKSHFLPLFISSRGHNLPHKFAWPDFEAGFLDKDWEKFITPTPWMYLDNDCSAEDYGRVYLLPEAVEKDQHRVRRPYQVGMIVLEIQEWILSFLLRCVREILHDYDDVTLTTANSRLATASITWPKHDESPSITEYSLARSYGIPQTMNLKRLQSLASSKLSSIEDEVWQLREDPGYFRHTLTQWAEHCVENFKEHDPQGSYWENGLELMLQETYMSLIMWDRLSFPLNEMPPIEEQFDKTNPNFLQKGLERRWGNIIFLLTRMGPRLGTTITSGVPASPSLRKGYDWDREKPGLSTWRLKRNHTEAERKIFLMFATIIPGTTENLRSSRQIVQEIQHTLDTDDDVSDLIDSWVTLRFSDFALITEIKTSIEDWFPWCATLPNVNPDDATPPIAMEKGTANAAYKVLQLRRFFGPAAIVHLGDPYDRSFNYPDDHHRTKKTVDQMRLAESCLAYFWEKLDEYDAKGTTLLGLAIGSSEAEERIPSRTEAWNEEVEGIKPSCTITVAAVDEEEDEFVSFDSQSSEEVEGFVPPTPKNKVKTRPATAPIPPAVPAPEVEHVAEEPPLLVRVHKRSMKVLAALFPPPSAEGHQRVEFSWGDLCKALCSIGMMAEKQYGSVWKFEPTVEGRERLRANRSVELHEARECRKGHQISHYMIMTYGRRLRRAYGWTWETFIGE